MRLDTETADVTKSAAPVSESLPDQGAKKPRKRAADFLDEKPEVSSAAEPAAKKGKKSKKETAVESESLTADGVNGVIEEKEDAGVKITTAKTNKKSSMMAEAAQTQDTELEAEFGGVSDEENEEIDAAPALLTGFDSDNDDAAEDKDYDASKAIQPIPQFKKTSKKLRAAAAAQSGPDKPGTVYVGRVPHGFYEHQMRAYFEQFGTITRLRLSRNKATGASKHFAFIEFSSEEVAKIVAETMDNYLMFGHILKCKFAPAETLHQDVWKGANKKFRKMPKHRLLREKIEAPMTDAKLRRKNSKTQKKREEQQEKLKELGYEYELPVLKRTLEQNDTTEDVKEIESSTPAGILVPPQGIPKDELAVKVDKQAKKGKKEKRTSSSGMTAAQEPTSESVPVDTANTGEQADLELPSEKSKDKAAKKAKKEAEKVAATASAPIPTATTSKDASDAADKPKPDTKDKFEKAGKAAKGKAQKQEQEQKQRVKQPQEKKPKSILKKS